MTKAVCSVISACLMLFTVSVGSALGQQEIQEANELNQTVMKLYQAGKYAEAIPLARRALGLREQALGPMHPDVATSLNYLGALLENMGDYAEARPLMERALKINEQALGSMHPAVAASLNNLALLLQNTGDYAGARRLMERALKINEQALGPMHPAVAGSLNNLAALLGNMGDYVGARPLYERALRIYEQVLGPMHPFVAASLSGLATLEAAQRRFGPASGLLKRALRLEDFHIQNVFNITTEAQKLAFIRSISGTYGGYLSLIHQHLNTDAEALRDGLELVLRRKGIVFDAQSRTRETLKGRLSETARKDFDQLSALRSELARFLLSKPAKMNPDIYKEKINSLQKEIEAIAQRLAGESALVAKELQQRTITIELVSKQLPKNAALAEFVKIFDFDFTKGRWKPSSRYLAFILTTAGNVTLVDLGEAEALEHQADRTLEDIKVAMNTLRGDHLLKSQESLAQLSALVWKPLESSLGQADRLIVSPDGQLNLVPFAALVEGAGQPLVERYHLTYVSSGRELIMTDAAFKPESELLLVANPAFDTQTLATEPGITAIRSRDFRRHFAPLPGTAREAEEIPPLVTGRADQKQVLVAAAATEGAVKATRSPRILHLATHGFFLEDQPIKLEPVGRQPGFGASEGIGISSASLGRYGNPLLRSGLAFAGANRAGEITEGDDGLLTALEITEMDLQGTDLVVLSACETAVGMVHTGEGVFGLRRAFALAGAKALLMSLWPVDDQVTADQMKAFYQNLQTLPPADVLRQAQRETIRRLKERDGVANTGLWAPFILQGANAFGSVHSVTDSK